MEKDHLLIRPRGDDGYKVFSVRIKEQTLQGIEEVAARTGRSRNELIGLMLTYALEHYTLEGGEGGAQSKRA